MPDQATGFLSPYLRRRRIAAALPYLRGRVLDIGCGVGSLAAHVNPRDYLGVDSDAESIREARRQHPQHRFTVASAADDGDDEFETVAALAVAEHVLDIGSFLTGVERRLSREGRIVLTTPNPSWDWVHALGAKVGVFSHGAAEEHNELLGRETLGSYAGEVGLQVLHFRKFLLGANQLFVLGHGQGTPRAADA